MAQNTDCCCSDRTRTGNSISAVPRAGLGSGFSSSLIFSLQSTSVQEVPTPSEWEHHSSFRHCQNLPAGFSSTGDASIWYVDLSLTSKPLVPCSKGFSAYFLFIPLKLFIYIYVYFVSLCIFDLCSGSHRSQRGHLDYQGLFWLVSSWPRGLRTPIRFSERAASGSNY